MISYGGSDSESDASSYHGDSDSSRSSRASSQRASQKILSIARGSRKPKEKSAPIPALNTLATVANASLTASSAPSRRNADLDNIGRARPPPPRSSPNPPHSTSSSGRFPLDFDDDEVDDEPNNNLPTPTRDFRAYAEQHRRGLSAASSARPSQHLPTPGRNTQASSSNQATPRVPIARAPSSSGSSSQSSVSRPSAAGDNPIARDSLLSRNSSSSSGNEPFSAVRSAPNATAKAAAAPRAKPTSSIAPPSSNAKLASSSILPSSSSSTATSSSNAKGTSSTNPRANAKSSTSANPTGPRDIPVEVRQASRQRTNEGRIEATTGAGRRRAARPQLPIDNPGDSDASTDHDGGTQRQAKKSQHFGLLWNQVIVVVAVMMHDGRKPSLPKAKMAIRVLDGKHRPLVGPFQGLNVHDNARLQEAATRLLTYWTVTVERNFLENNTNEQGKSPKAEKKYAIQNTLGNVTRPPTEEEKAAAWRQYHEEKMETWDAVRTDYLAYYNSNRIIQSAGATDVDQVVAAEARSRAVLNNRRSAAQASLQRGLDATTRYVQTSEQFLKRALRSLIHDEVAVEMLMEELGCSLEEFTAKFESKLAQEDNIGGGGNTVGRQIAAPVSDVGGLQGDVEDMDRMTTPDRESTMAHLLRVQQEMEDRWRGGGGNDNDNESQSGAEVGTAGPRRQLRYDLEDDDESDGTEGLYGGNGGDRGSVRRNRAPLTMDMSDDEASRDGSNSAWIQASSVEDDDEYEEMVLSARNARRGGRYKEVEEE